MMEDTRVRDYLDDKLQTTFDLDNLDALINGVEEQHRLLHQQLQEASEALHDARNASSEHGDGMKRQIEAFQKQQASIDRGLAIISQSDTSDDALRQGFEASTEKLRQLQIADGYIKLLEGVESARNDIQRAMDSPETLRLALKPYKNLRALLTALLDAQVAADGAAPHLMDHVQKLVAGLRSELARGYGEGLKGTLKKVKWPQRDIRLGRFTEEWTEWADILLELQEP